jgi:hypothetical protein
MSKLHNAFRTTRLSIWLLLCVLILAATSVYAAGDQRPLAAVDIIGSPDAAVDGKFAVGTTTPGGKALTVAGVIDFVGAGTVHNYFTQGPGNNMQIRSNVDEYNAVGNGSYAQWNMVMGASLDVFSIRRSPASSTYNEDALFWIEGSTGNIGISKVDTSNGATIPFTLNARLHVQTDSGDAIWGVSTTTSGNTYGVYGRSDSTDGYGVYGFATSYAGQTFGVVGASDSSEGAGVLGGVSTTTGYTYGVYGQSASTDGTGVFGFAYASSGNNYGVHGLSYSTSGAGVFGMATASSGNNYGVFGVSSSTTGKGVHGGATTTTGDNFGVYGESASTDGTGVYGWTYASSGSNVGVYGRSSSSTMGWGVYGRADSSIGYGTGVQGISESTDGWGVYGWASSSTGTTFGVEGYSESTDGIGVSGYAGATSGTTYGVYGYAASTDGYAGYFDGNVQVTGTLSKSAGSFKIDHPLDPDGKYLYHSFVESPDMKNIYDGMVTLDDSGAARVQLPDWFEALNKDFRYQLTPIGAAMPDLHIAQEIQDNAFRIAGGEPGMKVAWLVTGIRHDPYAEDNRIPVEEAKSGDEAGTYLYPEGYGQPESAGLDAPMSGHLLTPDVEGTRSLIRE